MPTHQNATPTHQNATSTHQNATSRRRGAWAFWRSPEGRRPGKSEGAGIGRLAGHNAVGIMQAHRQAPWRAQTQRLVILLIIAILGISILWVMLSVTVAAGAAGLEIQNLQAQHEELKRHIASQRTQYADLTSAARMTQQAASMGFEPVKPEEIAYIVVPSYAGRQSLLPAHPSTRHPTRPLLKPAYTQSLWEWMLQGVLTLSEQNATLTPAGGPARPTGFTPDSYPGSDRPGAAQP